MSTDKTECTGCGLPTQVDDDGLCNQCHDQSDTDDYFCIGVDGKLWALGNHGDYQAAEDTAASLGVDVVWMFGSQTAADWRDSLLQAIPNETRTTPLTELEQSLLVLCQQALHALHEDDFPHLRNQLREAVARVENEVLANV